METKSITISLSNFVKFEARLDVLNRKADKLNLDRIKILNLRHFVEKVEQNNRNIFVDKVEITLSNNNPIKFGNYTFIGTIDHNEGFGNIIKNVPNQNIPEKYFEAHSNCDHCNVNRFRKETFIFKDDNGYKQVGRTCLSEFFGIDPAKRLEFYTSIDEVGEFDEDTYSGSNAEIKYDTIEVLSIALAIIDELGYVSKTKALETNTFSTSGLILDVYYPGENREFSNRILANKVNFIEKSKDIISWGIEHYKKSNTEYSHNMKTILNSTYIKSNLFGYLISAYPQYVKELASITEAKNNNYKNEFIGIVDEKVTVDVSVTKITQQINSFGITFIISMLENNTNNKLVWFASNPKIKEGESYKITGKVKAHNEWNGINQTVLTRCKAV